MTAQWQYQIRLQMTDEFAQLPDQRAALQPVLDVVERHNATVKSQYDAFAGYLAEAEANGVEKYHLYEWTRATIENPKKREKYQKAFTVYVDGQEVYDREIAEAIEADLQQLVGGKLVKTITKHDTNPANNPQMPAKYRK